MRAAIGRWLTLGCFASAQTSDSAGAAADSDAIQPPTKTGSGFDKFRGRSDNSWLRDLEADPAQGRHHPNQRPRNVDSGHFVLVRPSPLPRPIVIARSQDLFEALYLDSHAAASLLDTFSGNVSGGGLFNPDATWATPYALSIYGNEHLPQGSGPDGHGYGDGRAISIAEILDHKGKRWELQLKGAGRTPFCRGGDGRAVLRSSVREFLASEAMHNLRVPTTRALSLVASASETVERPWYSKSHNAVASSSSAPVNKHGGDITQREATAITTRACSSFLRVGHFELFARRAERAGKRGFTQRRGEALNQLALLVSHALRREPLFGAIHEDDRGARGVGTVNGALQAVTPNQVARLAEGAARGMSFAAAEWIRVGFVQSNYNSDNCHVTGQTLDFGPFGFIERYDPKFAMWVGSGNHYSFMNQPKAAGMNFKSLVNALLILLSDDVDHRRAAFKGLGDDAERAAARSTLESLSRNFDRRATAALYRAISAKLGLGPLPLPPMPVSGDGGDGDGSAIDDIPERTSAARSLWKDLESLMITTGVDWTIFWRQLAVAAVDAAASERDGLDLHGDDAVSSCAADSEGNVAKAFGTIHRAFFPQDDGSSSLTDSHVECKSWAASGECSSNPAYMLPSCAHACRALERARSRATASLGSTTNPVIVGADAVRRDEWLAWLRRWLALCPDGATMLQSSPKFVPREWMLVKAYDEAALDLAAEAAAAGTGEVTLGNNASSDEVVSAARRAKRPPFQELRRLQALFQDPYGEQSEEATKRYFRLPPKGASDTGGIGFMS